MSIFGSNNSEEEDQNSECIRKTKSSKFRPLIQSKVIKHGREVKSKNRKKRADTWKVTLTDKKLE